MSCYNEKCPSFANEYGCTEYDNPDIECPLYIDKDLPSLVLKAERWDALMSCQRMRILGTGRLGNPKLQLIGLELWSTHPEPVDNTDAKNKITTFVDAIIKSKK